MKSTIATSDYPRVVFPVGFTKRDRDEMRDKGFVFAAIEISDGSQFRCYFVDPTRLRQDVDATLNPDIHYYFEPGLVVVPEITLDALQRAATQLVSDGALIHFRKADFL